MKILTIHIYTIIISLINKKKTIHIKIKLILYNIYNLKNKNINNN